VSELTLILAGAMLLALGLHALNTYLGGRGETLSYLTWNFYALWCAHVFWAVLAGFILWYAEIWPAGDAKFFILVSSALPLANPYLRNFPGSLFLSLLVNVFVSAALWALVSFLASGFSTASPRDFFSEIWRDSKKRLAGLTERRNDLATAVYLVNLGVLFLLQQILAREASGFIGRFFSRPEILFFFIFMLWDKLRAVFSSRRWGYVSVFLCVVYFVGGVIYSPEHMRFMAAGAARNVAKFSALLFLGRFILEFLMEKKDLQYLTVSELAPGVMLSAKTARMLKENAAFNGMFDDCFKDGLTGEQVLELTAWMNKLQSPDPKIEVVRGRPFALWIFVGAALSLLLDSNIAKLLR